VASGPAEGEAAVVAPAEQGLVIRIRSGHEGIDMALADADTGDVHAAGS